LLLYYLQINDSHSEDMRPHKYVCMTNLLVIIPTDDSVASTKFSAIFSRDMRPHIWTNYLYWGRHTRKWSLI